MFWETFFALCKEKKTTPTAVCVELGLSNATATQWKKGKVPHHTTLMRIADYFGVTVDYLLGKKEQTPSEPSQTSMNDVKVALFGGDGDVTDEMWDEVVKFADYVKAKYLKDKK